MFVVWMGEGSPAARKYSAQKLLFSFHPIGCEIVHPPEGAAAAEQFAVAPPLLPAHVHVQGPKAAPLVAEENMPIMRGDSV